MHVLYTPECSLEYTDHLCQKILTWTLFWGVCIMFWCEHVFWVHTCVEVRLRDQATITFGDAPSVKVRKTESPPGLVKISKSETEGTFSSETSESESTYWMTSLYTDVWPCFAQISNASLVYLFWARTLYIFWTWTCIFNSDSEPAPNTKSTCIIRTSQVHAGDRRGSRIFQKKFNTRNKPKKPRVRDATHTIPMYL